MEDEREEKTAFEWLCCAIAAPQNSSLKVHCLVEARKAHDAIECVDDEKKGSFLNKLVGGTK